MKKLSNPLLIFLYSKMRRDGLSGNQLALKLSVSPSYLSQFFTGDRSIEHANDKFLRAAANYLELSTVKVFLLSGKLLSEDFFEKMGLYQSQIDNAIRLLGRTDYGMDSGVTINELLLLTNEMKLLLVQLYETAEQCQLLPQRLSKDDVLKAPGIRVPFEVNVEKP